MKPFLITGCGRSGTAWAARVFTMLGHPCVHEAQFTWFRNLPLRRSESSWMAVPHLDSLPVGTPVLRILRNPYDVVHSAMAKGFLRHGADAYDMYVEHHRPDIANGREQLGRVIRWVATWDEPLDHLDHADLYIGSISSVAAAAHYATGEDASGGQILDALIEVGVRTNTVASSERMPAPTVDQIKNHPDGPLITARAQRFGYEEG